MREMVDFPSRGKVADALLAFIGLCDGVVWAAETYIPLAEFFALSEAHLSRKTKPGGRYWENKLQWAREELAAKGFIERPRKQSPTASQRGNKGVPKLWSLTTDGKRASALELSRFGSAARNHLQGLAAPIRKLRPCLDDEFS